MLQRLCLILFFTLTLSACATMNASTRGILPGAQSELAQGQRDFEAGYYKKAMRRLLPLACDGNPDAQYAIGYLYYYGYGVSQDTDVGYFWIKRAADHRFQPAIKALNYITLNASAPPKD